MMGTSLLSMPWALEQAGLLMGLACMAVIAGLCLYTAYRIIQVYDIHSEYHSLNTFTFPLQTLLFKVCFHQTFRDDFESSVLPSSTDQHQNLIVRYSGEGCTLE